MTPARLILGTAGHIDHGKTSLVRALTGVDTDRLAEEKRRGITIELGFARYAPSATCSFGIVDVPGHEGFVRTMVAGATGMDIVLLVVAADESVMPQTREHLAIVQLLGVEGLVAAITKADLVDDEWIEMVTEDVQDLLSGTPYEGAEVVPVSVNEDDRLEALSAALVRCASTARERRADDLFRLPVDRVFTVGGAGTVATGTLWSGSLRRGDVVGILPGGGSARVRAAEVHGEQVKEAHAGQRTALALTGATVRRGMVSRGDVLVTHPAWAPSPMLTVELTALPGTGWRLVAGQRVRVHLGTSEAMARVALLGLDEAAPGERLLAQLRLESPLVARCGDRFVVRSYSPVTTIAGGTVLEPQPPKRKQLRPRERAALERLARGGVEAVAGAAALAGWTGLEAGTAGVRAGWRGGDLPKGLPVLAGRIFDPDIVASGESRLMSSVREWHRARQLEPGIPLDQLRTGLPSTAHAGLADALVARLVAADELVLEGKVARLPDFEPTLSNREEAIAKAVMSALSEAGLQGPATDELIASVLSNMDAGGLRDRPSGASRAGGSDERRRVESVLGFLDRQGRIRLVSDAFWVTASNLKRAATAVTDRLGGRSGLGPADFREALPVTRKHLIPLLAHLDAAGVTLRTEAGRSVAASPP